MNANPSFTPASAERSRRLALGLLLLAVALGIAVIAIPVWLLNRHYSSALETNSSLDGAIRLYERLGFRHAPWPHPSDYARGDVYMELVLDPARS